MAPAATSRSRRRQASQPQSGLSATFARVSKNVAVTKSEKDRSIAAKKFALEELEQHGQQQQKKPRPSLTATSAKNKRKRDECESDDEDSSITVSIKATKKSKLQLPTPPPSTPERATPEIVFPAAVAELVEIHRAFLKAFAIHRAHNGASAPAELGQLLESVTRLYRKRIVSVVDLQRMLALFEINMKLAATTTLQHAKSPFRLLISGMGVARRQSAEFVGYETQSMRNGRTVTVKVSEFNDTDLRALYETSVERVYTHQQLNGSAGGFPLLDFSIGSQTIARQNKASETRKLILDGRKPDLDFGKLSVKDDTEPESTKTQTVKSRTLSLFDRVKAKQIANAAVKAPSAEDLQRKHAIGRVAEVVEILRMKQQQKLRGLVLGRKASFAFSQIVAEVNASLSIPMGDAEIGMCLEILAKEVGDGWCSIFELGVTRTVVLSGMGKSGKEVEVLLKGQQ